MIPLHLRISGFLSYLDPVELDFKSFDLACISGQNGAGKSSLLDSITWVLFGEARGKSSDVINLNQDVKSAEVALIFSYENNIYRVQRTLPRGKSTVLEFQVLDGGDQKMGDERWNMESGTWKPLTEKTTRDTQARIEQTLRLDYETFINASFFLQGKADQFTQKKASERKSVLSTILGLEIWDTYKERTAEKRKAIESEVNSIDGRIAEIDAELAEEDIRKTRLQELEINLKQLTSARAAQESILENIKKTAAVLNEQRKLVETFAKSLGNSRSSLIGIESRLMEKQIELKKYADLISRAKEIESAYKAWQKARAEVEKMDQVAAQFREYDEKRQPLLREIEVEKAKLEQELEELNRQSAAVEDQTSGIQGLQKQVEEAQESLKSVEEKISRRDELKNKTYQAREKHAALKVENETLRREMDEFKSRIDSLEKADGAECPLCGQELSEAHRKSTLKELNREGKQKGDQFRANKKEIEDIEKEIADSEANLKQFGSIETERMKFSNIISQFTERIESLRAIAKDWKSTGEKRLKEVKRLLESGKYASESQKELAKLDKELAKLGYDAAAHDAVRKHELENRSLEDEHSNLKSAREVNQRIEKEIKELEEERRKKSEEVAEQEKNYNDAARLLAGSEAGAPNLNDAERELFRLREDENLVRSELGGAEQKVKALETLRARKADYGVQREELNQNIARHKTLERAFGKDGVPALLIEQSLPQIEQKANDLLDRLSDGHMSIRFVTQAEYKDKKRDDLKETLDIQISDSAGTRNYEMYSGGEAFRVNFAIRLALSEILAQRKGARLQTLVIDEGFGSQDVQGRQRLIEAINLVKNDFAKILVITHLDELKDAFPNRIEVEKTDRGSTVTVI
ncbi:MAG: SMC family ATPase [Anaerolineales bacterium]|nr:SMC family ATPase [Anaerolineales bacterium]